MNRVLGRLFVIATAMVLAISPAAALNIVLTNDDGFETANITELYRALKSAGHDVVITAPFGEQSGRSAYISTKPIEAVEADSPKGTVKAGSPGIGQHPDNPDIFYVNATPAMTAFFGMDIVATKRWGKLPDLLIAGPNEGHNLGYITNYSGTLGAAVTAIRHGVPAIAVSADRSTKKNPALAPEVAHIVVGIVGALESNRPDGQLLLPAGTGLNVNVPRFDPGQSAALRTKFTQVGNHAIIGGTAKGAFGIRFYEDKRDDPILGRHYKSAVAGLGIDLKRIKASDETNPNAEALHVASKVGKDKKVTRPGSVTISVIDGDLGAGQALERAARERMQGLGD
jgi:5'-nucleotidase